MEAELLGVVGLAPRKMKGWNLKITHEKKGKSSSQSHHSQVPALNLPGCRFLHVFFLGQTLKPFNELQQVGGSPSLLVDLGRLQVVSLRPPEVSPVCPPKIYQAAKKGKDRLPSIIFSRGKLFNFGDVYF